jgi:FkbM family methyltransferase
MKFKELFYYLGYRPRTREYTFELDRFELPRDGRVEFARWRHPKQRRGEIRQASVDGVRAFLREGEVGIDIGAHTGDTTIPMALAAGPTGAVFALEPNPYVFKVLLANAALNRTKTNIYPLMFAATEEDGEYDFQYSDPGFCNGGYLDGLSSRQHAHFFTLPVVGRNLLDYLRREFPECVDRITYVKIDTEGYDRSVTASLKALLTANRPYLRTEIYKRTDRLQREGYYNDLRALGYRVHKFHSEEDHAGQPLSRDDMMSWEHFDVFAVHESRG